MPAFAGEAQGPASIETFTVLHDRDGAPHHGVVILRLPDGRRALGRVPGGYDDTIALLKRQDRTPIGTEGVLRRAVAWFAARGITVQRVLTELRRFYRLADVRKLAHIERQQ